MLREKVRQLSIDKEDTLLLTAESTINASKALNLLLVFIFMMQLFLPVVTYAEDVSNENENSEPLVVGVQAEEDDDGNEGDISDEKEIENVEADNSATNEEPPAEVEEDVNDEPINKPKQNTNEQPNAPPKVEEAEEKVKPEEKPVEEEKENPKNDFVEEDNEDEVEDPGAMLDGFPATEHPDKPTNITHFAAGSLGSALVLLRESNKMRSMSDLQPGEIKTIKTAKRVLGMVNTWDITVRIEGRDDDEVETTDVVLVIDRSGSMADNRRMINAKNAAKNFIDAMIPVDPNLRIAIVSFSSDHSTWEGSSNLIDIDHQFSNNQNDLKDAVDSLSAFGGTHTQAGIIQGEAMLTGSNADNKFMVLLSDGQPTFSYEPTNWTNGRPSWGSTGTINNNRQRTGVYDGYYNIYSVVGDGSNLTQSYNYNAGSLFNPNLYRRHIHNGDAAIKAGEDARVGFDGLFTIAVQAGDQGTPILRDIASAGMAYSTENPEELNEIYNRIGTQIQTQYALRNVVLTDEMGDGFSLISSTIDTTEGSTAVATANPSNNDRIIWTIDPAVTNLVEGTDDVRYAEMTYRVEINDDILNLEGAKTDENKLFATNKVTELTYTDVDDVRKNESITSPKVDPVLLKMKKILKDENGNVVPSDPRRFNVNVNKSTPNVFDHTEALAPGADYVWLTTLRHEGTYNVEEISITGDGLTNLDAYTISYAINGIAATSFLVNHINNKPRGDIKIDVTNQKIGDAIPDESLIRLSKTFAGLTEEQIAQLTDFKIVITSKNDSSITRELLLADAVEVVTANGEITYKWVLEGWPAGTYTVTEAGETFPGYDVNIENDGEVEIEAATIDWTNDLWKKPNTEVNNDLRVNGIPANIVATKLSGSAGVFVWTEERLSASQRLAVVEALSGWNELGLTMNNGYWHSGDDIEGTDFYFRGYRIQYNQTTGNLHIPQSNQWALIISGKYLFEEEDPADLAIKNTYTIKTIDFSFTKVDEEGEPLAGSEFILEREVDRTEISNMGIDPEFIFAELTEGRYILRETKAPPGYNLPTTSWVIEVERDETTGELKIIISDNSFLSVTDEGYQFENTEQSEFPQTGGLGVLGYFGVGMLTMLSSIGLYLKKDKNGGRKNE